MPSWKRIPRAVQLPLQVEIEKMSEEKRERANAILEELDELLVEKDDNQGEGDG